MINAPVIKATCQFVRESGLLNQPATTPKPYPRMIAATSKIETVGMMVYATNLSDR